MNMLVQEKINELKKIDINSKSYIEKYNEILKTIINLDEIYTVVRRNRTDDEVNNKSKVFFGISNHVPTMWIFSGKEIANEYVEYYQLKKNHSYLVKKIEFEELLLVSYFAMFSGISQVIIDEGRDYLICNIYDLVNECFIKYGQPPVLDKGEYPIMNILNSVKFSNKKLWVVPNKSTTDEKVLSNKFIPVTDNNHIKIFINRNDSEKYSKKQGNKSGITIEINIRNLENIIKSAIDNYIKYVEFFIDNKEVKISANKLYNILQRMN